MTCIKNISIHAPRTGSDPCPPELQPCHAISIHAPRTGSDLTPAQRAALMYQFQSTLPARGATKRRYASRPTSRFQSTLPARGATIFFGFLQTFLSISIHAPRTGSDSSFTFSTSVSTTFQSTLPARGATQRRRGTLTAPARISIHAPRTGSDLGDGIVTKNPCEFQSTLPARGATVEAIKPA